MDANTQALTRIRNIALTIGEMKSKAMRSLHFEGTPIIRRIEEELHQIEITKQVWARCHKSERDRKECDEDIQSHEKSIKFLVSLTEQSIMNSLIEGRLVGIGLTNPQKPAMQAIPQSTWVFLELDYDTERAEGEAGLYAEVRVIGRDIFCEEMGKDGLLKRDEIIEPRRSKKNNDGKTGILEKQIAAVEAVVTSMKEEGVFDPTSKRWPKTDIWERCVDENDELFPNDKADMEECGFHKAYTSVKQHYK